MKAVALRGVCIGPGQHLVAGQEADLDAATFQFLSGIQAVRAAQVAEMVEDQAPAKPAQEEPAPKGAKAPKKGT